MLEIKHLTKVYHTKGGDTVALDDVSISFPETGLVFLLGKSGSGKSTLLNLAGGLDEPTSGEVVVMGKSSHDFSGGDFDSYRNTFVGFIFQEYNVLNEFNVEDNIALALELQGKPKDKAKIQEILRQVELEAYAKRRPNTLSGGQKQRIAIARALVKDPQIIMADEPTGALDSATGKQVFETLKKLSETRLVLVVSHDREFAEIYGDRIVELKDGKIISDISKTKEAPNVGGRVVRLGSETMTVRRDAPIDDETLAEIAAFLREGEGEVLISKSGSDIASFKRANRIDAEGGRERFEDTAPQELPAYDGSKTKFIRSRLPVRKAIKIGASGLKLKPLRLVFTIFLSFVAFTLFGLFSTMMLYNGKSVLVTSFSNSDIEYLNVQKRYQERITVNPQGGDSYSYTNYYDAQFTPAEIERISEGVGDAFGAYTLGYSSSSLGNVMVGSDKSNYYVAQVNYAAELPESIRLLAGTLPVNADEVLVSSYLYDVIANGEYHEVDGEGKIGAIVKIQTQEALLGKNIMLGRYVFKVTGVFDSGTIPAKYDKIKNGEEADYMLAYSFSNYLRESLHGMLGVTGKFAEKYPELVSTDSGYVNAFQWAENSVRLELPEYYDMGTLNRTRCYAAADAEDFQLTFLSAPPEKLNDYELIVSDGNFFTAVYAQTDLAYQEAQEAADEALMQQLEELKRALSIWQSGNVEGWIEVPDPNSDDPNSTMQEYFSREATEEELAAAKAAVTAFVASHPLTFPLSVNPNGMTELGSYDGDYTIIGFYPSEKMDWDGVFCAQQLYEKFHVYSDETRETNYEKEPDARFGNVFIAYNRNEGPIRTLLGRIGEEHIDENDVYYVLQSSLYQNVEMTNDLVSSLSKAFLIAGIVLAVFAALLLFNFISMSIANKKKEIGILRAVGARGTDVFKIFFSESGIIVGICTVLSLIGTAVLAAVMNTLLKADAGLDVALFVFGPLSAVVMIGVALVVALIGTFLPVYFAAKKKPVESIRAL